MWQTIIYMCVCVCVCVYYMQKCKAIQLLCIWVHLSFELPVLSHNLPQDTEENRENPRLARVPPEIQTRRLLKMSEASPLESTYSIILFP